VQVWNKFQHTISVGKCGDEPECRIWEVRRRMEPIGTGLVNDIPSSDKKRTGERVKRVAFVNPSCRLS
jgi:hypothetical protein